MSWEGWTVIAVFLVTVVGPAPFLGETEGGTGYLIWVFAWTAVLLALCVVKGTKPGGFTRKRR